MDLRVIICLLFIVGSSVLYANETHNKDNNITLKQNKEEKIIPIKAITYFEFGTPGKPLIEIYITPSCTHCADFVLGKFTTFVTNNATKCQVKLILLPVAAKDFFIMKIIQASVSNTTDYYRIFFNYIDRAVKSIKHVRPSKKQIEMYKGSNNDPEMIKFQVIAHEFQFTDEEIINAFPNMNDAYEQALVQHYDETSKRLNKLINSKDLNLPLIIHNGKVYDTLQQALDACNASNSKNPN